MSENQKWIEQINSEKEALLIYLQSKVTAKDWHAVADAAMDLREIEAKLSVLSELISSKAVIDNSRGVGNAMCPGCLQYVYFIDNNYTKDGNAYWHKNCFNKVQQNVNVPSRSIGQ